MEPIIKRQIKVPLKDLNQEMGIEISIPDPLKRQMPSRRYGGQSRSRTTLEAVDVLEDTVDQTGVEIQETIEVVAEKDTTTEVTEIATADVVDGNNCKT